MIKVSLETGGNAYINESKIDALVENEEGTTDIFVDAHLCFEVKETPEVIIERIKVGMFINCLVQ